MQTYNKKITYFMNNEINKKVLRWNTSKKKKGDETKVTGLLNGVY